MRFRRSVHRRDRITIAWRWAGQLRCTSSRSQWSARCLRSTLRDWRAFSQRYEREKASLSSSCDDAHLLLFFLLSAIGGKERKFSSSLKGEKKWWRKEELCKFCTFKIFWVFYVGVHIEECFSSAFIASEEAEDEGDSLFSFGFLNFFPLKIWKEGKRKWIPNLSKKLSLPFHVSLRVLEVVAQFVAVVSSFLSLSLALSLSLLLPHLRLPPRSRSQEQRCYTLLSENEQLRKKSYCFFSCMLTGRFACFASSYSAIFSIVINRRRHCHVITCSLFATSVKQGCDGMSSSRYLMRWERSAENEMRRYTEEGRRRKGGGTKSMEARRREEKVREFEWNWDESKRKLSSSFSLLLVCCWQPVNKSSP